MVGWEKTRERVGKMKVLVAFTYLWCYNMKKREAAMNRRSVTMGYKLPGPSG